ncbi:ribosomal protein uS13 [Patescibacteria group bacterium]
MARISGVTLPDRKKVLIGLTTIYGVGRSNVFRILKDAEVDPHKMAKDLTTQEITQLTKIISGVPVEGILKKQIFEGIKRLRTIGTYRGIRHGQGLPVRGQRTRSNARTKRGKRRTVGAMRKRDMSRTDSAQKSES